MARTLLKTQSVLPLSPRSTAALLASLSWCLASGAYAYQLKVTTNGSPVRWQAPAIELELAVVEDGSVSRAEVREALALAATTWTAIPEVPSIRVRDGRSRRWGHDGINGVYVLSRWPFADRRLAVTISTYRDDTGELLDTDVLINGEMALELGREECRPDRYDLGLLMTHELGHVLGLDESDVRSATMWPASRMGEMDRRELAVDDVDAALALYAAETPPAARARCSAATTRSRPSALLLGISAFVGLARLGRGRTRHART